MAISLKVQAAAGSTVEAAVREMQEVADRLGITVEADINGVKCLAFPGGSAEVLAVCQQQQQGNKDAKFQFASSRA